MYRTVRTAILSLLTLVLSLTAQAETFGAGIQNSQWYLSSSIFECRLTHRIPGVGEAVFTHEAGKPLAFYLEFNANPMQAGRAALVVEAPSWRPGAAVRDLGYVPVSQERRAIEVGDSAAARMMAGLGDGMSPTFTRKAWYGNERIRVRLSSINFNGHLPEFRNCVSGLLPVNFDQVKRTRVYFGMGDTDLDASDRKKLDDVVLYVKADPTVTSIYVDGHTSRSGRRIANRTLSKKRAEAVTRYLVDQGLSPDKITTRYHGDRYPATDVSSKRGAVDRRATVRLERETEPSMRARAPAPGPIDEATLEPVDS
ncbi:OmpA family protein [Marinobacteraceae bacterium S3BR75-40.1]